MGCKRRSACSCRSHCCWHWPADRPGLRECLGVCASGQRSVVWTNLEWQHGTTDLGLQMGSHCLRVWLPVACREEFSGSLSLPASSHRSASGPQMTSPPGKADALKAIAIAMQLLHQAISAKHPETPSDGRTIELSLLTSHHATRFPAFFPSPIRNTAACGAARPAGDLPHQPRRRFP